MVAQGASLPFFPHARLRGAVPMNGKGQCVPTKWLGNIEPALARAVTASSAINDVNTNSGRLSARQRAQANPESLLRP